MFLGFLNDYSSSFKGDGLTLFDILYLILKLDIDSLSDSGFVSEAAVDGVVNSIEFLDANPYRPPKTIESRLPLFFNSSCINVCYFS